LSSAQPKGTTKKPHTANKANPRKSVFMKLFTYSQSMGSGLVPKRNQTSSAN
jgi:hypothetical protein